MSRILELRIPPTPKRKSLPILSYEQLLPVLQRDRAFLADDLPSIAHTMLLAESKLRVMHAYLSDFAEYRNEQGNFGLQNGDGYKHFQHPLIVDITRNLLQKL